MEEIVESLVELETRVNYKMWFRWLYWDNFTLFSYDVDSTVAVEEELVLSFEISSMLTISLHIG